MWFHMDVNFIFLATRLDYCVIIFFISFFFIKKSFFFIDYYFLIKKPGHSIFFIKEPNESLPHIFC